MPCLKLMSDTVGLNISRPDVRFFCAVDTADLDRAKKLAADIAVARAGIKLGLEFFMAQGRDGVQQVMQAAREITPETPLFLDLKLHDIPNTVAGAVSALKSLTPDFLTVHAGGGLAMMQAAVTAAHDINSRILAVTVLTHLEQNDLSQTGCQDTVTGQVLRLARLAQQADCAGIVCSGQELADIRRAVPADFVTMVPGIRPEGSDQGDQKRILTPRAAVDLGADYLVIGRPVTQNPHPARILAELQAELTGLTAA